MKYSSQTRSNLLLTTYALLFFVVRHGAPCSHLGDLSHVYAPLPATAYGPDIGVDGYAVVDFGDGAYMVTEGVYQSLFLVSTDGVILVDAPPTIGRKLQYAIGNNTDLPVTHFIYSHHHADHIGAAYLFIDTNTEVIAHVDTVYQLSQAPDLKRPLPTTTFQHDRLLIVGNQTLSLSYKGPNHSPGNIFIYGPKQKILMLVDVVYPGWIPFTALAISSNIPGWVAAHDQLLEYDFNHYIGGHLGRAGNRSDVELQKEYVLDLLSNCNETIQLTATNDTVFGAQALLGPVGKVNPGNSWAQFKAYLDVAGEYCANKTNEKWVGRLGGADVFGFENGLRVVESLRIDYDVLGPFGVV